MYVIKHIKNDTYFKNKINQDSLHYVRIINEAHQFKSKKDAQKMLENFNHPEHFEIIKSCIR